MRQFLRILGTWVALIGGIILLAYLLPSRSGSSESSAESSMPAATTFYGYACKTDCSGHEAGYAWAERKGITDPDDCGGKSQSFIEGCKAFAAGRF
jgi:hypothetical protein